MEIFFIRALQLILCFMLLVVLHEGGHFLFAKIFKVRVEKFCLFFDPWFTLFKFKPKKSDTTYALGWLPLGGYVKISGMIDESMDTEQMKQPVKPWEFRAKPAWQRLFIMIGGVLVNFLTALAIYAMVLFTWGDTYTPLRNMTDGLKFNEMAQSVGFRDGDIPLRTDAVELERMDGDMFRAISEAHSVTVLRDGKEVTFSLPGDLSLLEMLKDQPRFAEVLMPSRIDSVTAGGVAEKAGIRAGDELIGYNGQAFSTWNEYAVVRGSIADVLAQGNAADSMKMRQAALVVRRAETGMTDTLNVMLGKDYKLGITWNLPTATRYESVTRTYGFFESFPAGAVHGWKVLTGYVDDLKYIFTAEGAKSVGSFGAIGSMFPAVWDWQRFWELTAFISLMLAFMNILPIPALDGGHVFFLLVEVIMRRKPSDKFMERAQTVGMTLLLLLMAFALFNDFRNFLF
ncbi:MAG: RIP metalloprotease RseP [Bacteroidales bacterium]|nr:RIP metalloprotease RseP [Bacteroidales bacterium]